MRNFLISENSCEVRKTNLIKYFNFLQDFLIKKLGLYGFGVKNSYITLLLYRIL